MFVYDGLSINSVTMAGNRYLNFILVVLIEIPGALVTAKMMTMFGRRLSLSGSFILAALCCSAYHFLPAGECPAASCSLLQPPAASCSLLQSPATSQTLCVYILC